MIDARFPLLARLRTLTPRSRAMLGVAGVLVALAAGIAGFASRDTRVALFATPLRADQLAEVEQRLAAWNVAFASGADNVRVERARRADLLLRLALAGVPHRHLAGTGEALAHAGALTPPAVLEAQTRDALAADLALGLRGIDGVADARVVIAPPAGGVYADDPRREASASVRVTLASGARLSARTVAGIAAFVAGGVPGLDASRVTVVDDRGAALRGDSDDDDGGDVQSALQSALDAAFGAGATIVRVHRERSAESREVHDVRRSALDGSLARTTSDERYASSAKKYSKASATEDRGSDTREERRVSAAGATARLSVAVFVDAARELDLTKIRALAAATAGIRSERGDALSVEAVAFAPSVGTPARGAHAPSWVIAFAGVLPQAVCATCVVLVVAFAAPPLSRFAAHALDASSRRAAVRDVAGIAPSRVHGALAGEPPHIAAAIISALPTATAAAVLELYPAEERTAIVRRLARRDVALLPRPEELFRELA